MKTTAEVTGAPLGDGAEWVEPVPFDFEIGRRRFVQVLGAGLVVAVAGPVALAQRAGGRTRPLAARLHLGQDGVITVLTGKVELGQGARAELSQAAAEELRVPVDQIRMLMADTGLVPDDGTTAGSRTTPATVPVVRQAAAAARNLLVELACKRWAVGPETVEVLQGRITHRATNRALTYADLAAAAETVQAFERPVPAEVTLTPVKEWKVLGTSVPRPNRRDLVTGAHRFPSDTTRPGMLRGKVLRPPSYGARLTSIDLAPAQALPEVVVVRDGTFVGVAAPTAFRAAQALQVLSQTAVWEPAPHPSSRELSAYLKDRVRAPGELKNPFAEELGRAAKVWRQTYQVAPVQHAPLEPRAAVAEWADGKLTVWTGTQNPFGYHSELVRAFRLSNDQVRVIVPDIGGGFGGKHTGEAAIEAARLARGAGRPVALQWTREEEFTWAYFRPAAVIEVEAGLDAQGAVQAWHFININSGGAALETPYRIPRVRHRFLDSEPPVRQGSYRALAATANNFARECAMDELAGLAGVDALEFRLAHLENPRLRAVLEAAAQRFDWKGRKQRCGPNAGVGLACGTEKGSYVAACVEVSVDPAEGRIQLRHVCEVFECGAVLNPANLLSQVQGCILMGLGAALREEVRFEGGRVLTANFTQYLVPRFKDVPPLEIHLLDRPDLTSAGGGETPIIVIAPAIANAVFHAAGVRLRQMPIRLPPSRAA